MLLYFQLSFKIDQLVEINHTNEEFNGFRKGFKIKIEDGKISVYNVEFPNNFLMTIQALSYIFILFLFNKQFP